MKCITRSILLFHYVRYYVIYYAMFKMPPIVFKCIYKFQIKIFVMSHILSTWGNPKTIEESNNEFANIFNVLTNKILEYQ